MRMGPLGVIPGERIGSRLLLGEEVAKTLAPKDERHPNGCLTEGAGQAVLDRR